jgi:hypothetical protein
VAVDQMPLLQGMEVSRDCFGVHVNSTSTSVVNVRARDRDFDRNSSVISRVLSHIHMLLRLSFE